MWGTGAPDESTIPALFAKEGKGAYQAENFGESGYRAMQSYIYLLLKFNQGLKADWVISYDGVNEAVGLDMESMSGSWSTYGISVVGSTEYTQMRFSPKVESDGHHHLSNAGNGYRYDVTADMLLTNAVVTGRDALLAGRTIALQGDIFFDKKTKTYFIDSWLAEGATPDRYDNMAVVIADAGTTNAAVKAKADGKAIRTVAVA